MKQLLKKIIPEYILSILRNNSSKPTKNITYTGIYSHFQDVYNKYPYATNYNSDNSTNEEVEQARNKFNLLDNEKVPFHDWSNNRLNILPTFLSSFKNTKKINILDIGGGLGTSYINLKFACPDIRTDYTVYELPEIVNKSSFFSQSHKELSFTTDLTTLENKFDIVLISSSLQYFENYIEIINIICNFNPDFILLTDHPMGIVNTFVCAQVNMKDRVIPRHVYNLNEIISLFNENNYELRLQSVNYYPFHNFLNYDGDYSKTKHYNLAFKKNIK